MSSSACGRVSVAVGVGGTRRPASRLVFAFGAVAAAASRSSSSRSSGFLEPTSRPRRSPRSVARARSSSSASGSSRLRPGTFPSSTRTSWLDSSRGIAHWVQLTGGQKVEEVLVERGRMRRFLPAQHLLIVGSSCRAFASGCAELVDPVAFYRRALAGGGAVRSKREGDVYRLTLPLQSLPDAVRIEQVVTVDAETFLPKLIEWRENGRPVSRITIESIERIPRSQVYELLDLRTPARHSGRAANGVRGAAAEARREAPDAGGGADASVHGSSGTGRSTAPGSCVRSSESTGTRAPRTASATGG